MVEPATLLDIFQQLQEVDSPVSNDSGDPSTSAAADEVELNVGVQSTRRRGRPRKYGDFDFSSQPKRSNNGTSDPVPKRSRMDPDYEFPDAKKLDDEHSTEDDDDDDYVESARPKRTPKPRVFTNFGTPPKSATSTPGQKRRGRPPKNSFGNGTPQALQPSVKTYKTPIVITAKKNNSNYSYAEILDLQKRQSSWTAYQAFAPKVENIGTPVNSEDRVFVCKLDSMTFMESASGGFRLFVSQVTDKMMTLLYDLVKRDHELSTTDDELQLAQVIRHVYNVQSEQLKRSWEEAARDQTEAAAEAIKSDESISTESIVTQAEQMMAEDISAAAALESMDEDGKMSEMATLIGNETKTPEPDFDGTCCALMPRTEFPTLPTSKEVCPPKMMFATCCSVAKERKDKWSNFGDVVAHFMDCHYAAHFYACHFCSSLFECVDALQMHKCSAFQQFMLQRLMGGNAGKLEMANAHFYLTCEQCGTWLAIKMSYEGERLEKAWAYFLTVLKYHDMSTLVPVMVYSHDVLQFCTDPEHKDGKFTLRYGIPLTRNFPVSCPKCEKSFANDTPLEAESHLMQCQSEPAFTCGKCNVKFATEAVFRAHALNHMHDSAAFAAYLRMACRMLPPRLSNLPPIVGTNKARLAVGGIAVAITDGGMICDDKVEHFEPLARRKILNAMRRPVTEWDGESEDVGYDSDQGRTDVGLETFQYGSLESEEQTTATQRFKKAMKSNTVITKELIINPSDIMNALPDTVEMKAPTVRQFPLAEGLGKLFTRQTTLPVSACLDMISASLFTKRYVLCEKCNIIMVGYDGVLHKKTCDGEITTIVSGSLGVSEMAHCFKCDARLCSILSYRSHLLLEHSLFVDYKPPMCGSNYELLNLATGAVVPDKRSAVAREVDALLNMPTGLLKRNAPPPNRVLQAKVNIPSQNRPLVAYPAKPMLPQTHANNAGAGSRVAIPYSIDVYKGTRRFRCQFCMFLTQITRKLHDHLRMTHAIICRGCGSAFSSPELMQQHDRVCEKQFAGVSVGNIVGNCGICSVEMHLPLLYNHLFKDHLSEVRYQISTGMVIPVHKNIRVTNQMDILRTPTFAPHTIVQRTAMVTLARNTIPIPPRPQQPVPVAAPQQRIYLPPKYGSKATTCFLCEMVFANEEELELHHASHQERFEICPLCLPSVNPMRSVREFGKHLYDTHIRYSQGPKGEDEFACTFCHTKLTHGIGAHLLYHCTLSRRCGLCAESTSNAVEHERHMSVTHPFVFTRFCCTQCKQTFSHVGAYSMHDCRRAMHPHECQCGFQQVFSNRNAYNLHFGMHMVEMDDGGVMCNVCNDEFANKKLFNEHRPLHAIVDGSIRQLSVIESSLVLPSNEVDEKKEEERRLRKAKRQEEKEKRRQEKEFAKDIKRSVKSMVRTVCAELGEDIEEEIEEDEPELDAAKSPAMPTEEDDDDVVVLDIDRPSRTSTPGSHNSDSLPGPRNTLTALARVEGHILYSAGEGFPGYVEDDDGEGAPEQTGSRGATVRSVVDDNADGELEVVAEVDNPTGVAISTGRKKAFACDRCSLTFVTHAAMLLHRQKSHVTDAGGICNAVYGIPLTTMSVYVCRNCCVAFESRPQHAAHMKAHGNGTMSCHSCSAMSYNSTLTEQHLAAHAKPDKLFYACGLCRLTYNCEAFLFNHLSKVHNVRLLYFCKHCGFGSFDGATLIAHINRASPRCKQDTERKRWNVKQAIAMCPANQLHFQPMQEDVFKARLERRDLGVVQPSDCTHRSFLAPMESVVACKQCLCTMSCTTFSANEAALNGGVHKDISMSYDRENNAHPLDPYLARTYQPTKMVITPTANRLPPARYPPQPVRNGGPASSQPSASVHISTGPLLNVSAYQASRNSANGEIVTIDDDNSNSRPSALPSQQPPSSGLLPVRRVNPQQKQALSCRFFGCKQSLERDSIRALHQLHWNTNMYFCLDCATGHADEKNALAHYYREHVAVAERSAQQKHTQFRPIVYQLKCPFANCSEVLSSPAQLRTHLRDEHNNEMFSSGCCSTMFSSLSSKAAHERVHEEFEEANGIEGTCCLACGEVDQWTQKVASSAGTTYNVSHIAVHGVQRFEMCRSCFTCFKYDPTHETLIEHFTHAHSDEVAQMMRCRTCVTDHKKNDFAKHVIEKHLVVGMKSKDKSNTGTLIVQCDPAMRRYLGFAPSENDA